MDELRDGSGGEGRSRLTERTRNWTRILDSSADEGGPCVPESEEFKRKTRYIQLAQICELEKRRHAGTGRRDDEDE